MKKETKALLSSVVHKYRAEIKQMFVAQGSEHGLELGLKLGRQEGLELGRQEGLELGELKGFSVGARRALIQVLEARGLKVEGVARRRILACPELSRLELWQSEQRSWRSLNTVVEACGTEVRKTFEAAIHFENYRFQIQVFREFVAQGVEQGLVQGLERGRQEGLEQGCQEGIKQGEPRGLLEGERWALIQVLQARGFTVRGMARRRLMDCTELPQIDRWLRLAAKVESVRQLFEK